VRAARAPVETGAASRFGTSLWAELVARVRAQRHARQAGVEVGSRVRFGKGVRCVAPPGARIVLGQDVEIGDWTILEALPGGVLSFADGAIVARGCTIAAERHVSIGDDAIIGANAVVTRPVPANCIAVGVPACVVRENVRPRP
jgi:serine O-acetyltransferase